MTPHQQALLHMFHQAPVNKFFQHITLRFELDQAVVELPILPEYMHAGGSLHGALYMKLLDDAAYFSAALLESSRFLLTAGFALDFYRPVHGGVLTATGKVKGQEGKSILSASTLTDEDGNLVARGHGRFVPGNGLLLETPLYISGLPSN